MNDDLPAHDEDSQPWWDAVAKHRLTYQHCLSCGQVVFYPRNCCSRCLSDKLEWRQSRGAGSVYSKTLVHRAPDPRLRDQLPYPVVLVDLDEGFRMLSRLVGPNAREVQIGARVKVAFSPGPDGRTLPCFEPLTPSAGPEHNQNFKEGRHEET